MFLKTLRNGFNDGISMEIKLKYISNIDFSFTRCHGNGDDWLFVPNIS